MYLNSKHIVHVTISGVYFLLFRLGPNVALTHHNRSYRDQENVHIQAQKRKQRGGNDRKRTFNVFVDIENLSSYMYIKRSN